MTDRREYAHQPEDLTRLFVKRANAHDAAGLAELYEPDAVLATHYMNARPNMRLKLAALRSKEAYVA